MKTKPEATPTSTAAAAIELDPKDPRLGQVRFGRNKLLRLLGASLAGVATSVAAKKPAYAWHGSPPGSCYGYGACHCCSGSNCCVSGCVGHSHNHGCSSRTQCWTVQVRYSSDCYRVYRCCDWHSPNLCICRAYLGLVC
jgi:hypothetical protein